jgi:hypothetical protein
MPTPVMNLGDVVGTAATVLVQRRRDVAEVPPRLATVYSSTRFRQPTPPTGRPSVHTVKVRVLRADRQRADADQHGQNPRQPAHEASPP